MDSNLSLADIAAVTRNNNMDGFGDGNGWWIILILLFALGGNGFGYGNGAGRVATVEDVNNSANFTRLENQVRFNENAIQNGFSNTFNGIANLGYRELENFSTLRYDNAIGQKDIISAIQSCCCSTQKALAEEGAATRALIQENKIEALRDKVQALELQAAMFGTVKYPNSFTYATNGNPFCFNSCNGNI